MDDLFQFNCYINRLKENYNIKETNIWHLNPSLSDSQKKKEKKKKNPGLSNEEEYIVLLFFLLITMLLISVSIKLVLIECYFQCF